MPISRDTVVRFTRYNSILISASADEKISAFDKPTSAPADDGDLE